LKKTRFVDIDLFLLLAGIVELAVDFLASTVIYQ
jgi:hypothetical protein